MQTSSAYETGAGEGSKVAIARLDRRHPNRASDKKGKQETRVGKACTNCRKRKVKCSGEQPTCSNCVSANLECLYDLARRDKLRSATHQKQSLVALLSDLRLRVNSNDQQAIDEALLRIDHDIVSQASALPNISGKRRKHSPASADEADSQPGDETRVPASIGSNEDLDLLDEDLLRSKEARETGYVGTNSTVAWLRSLQKEVKQADGQPYGLPCGPPGTHHDSVMKRSEALHERRRKYPAHAMRPETTETTFYLDGESLELDFEVDIHELPPFELAERLFDTYLCTVHTSFPIMPNTMKSQFYSFFEAVRAKNSFRVPDKWLAQLNLCFAIGSHYSFLSDQDWKTNQKDHLIYMTRAVRLLALNDNWGFATAPDLPTIQVTGLLSFYYMIIGHVSRAWVTIGIAIRLALALGLHLRNEDPTLPGSKKETLLRTWWSLHSIECLVSSVIGRPCVLASEDCTVEFPHISTDGNFGSPSQDASDHASITSRNDRRRSSASATSSNIQVSMRKPGGPSSFLEAHISIGVITQKILSSLYSPRVGSQPWSYIQATIPTLLTELEVWRSHVLPHGNVKISDPFSSAAREREILQLRFYYYSKVILITRPCLCRTERRIKDQSDASFIFNDTTAKRCVKAAQDMADLLPEKPHLKYIFKNGPWWTLVHDIMQSLTVLLLELSYQCTHMLNEKARIVPRTKKLVHWLRAMRKTDPSSERAYTVVINIIRQSGHQFQAHAQDLLSEDRIEDDTDNEQRVVLKPPAQAFHSSESNTARFNPTDQGRSVDPMEFSYGAQDAYKDTISNTSNAHSATSMLPPSKKPNISPTAISLDPHAFHSLQPQHQQYHHLQHQQYQQQPHFYEPHPHPDYQLSSMQFSQPNAQQFPISQGTPNTTTGDALFFYHDPYSNPLAYANPFVTSFDQVNFDGFMGDGGANPSFLGDQSTRPTTDRNTSSGSVSMGGYVENAATGMADGGATQYGQRFGGSDRSNIRGF